MINKLSFHTFEVMEYTRYFASIVKQHGSINLNQDCLQAMFNVIHIEAKIEVYYKLDKFKYGIDIGKLTTKLRLLTANFPPQKLLEIWYSGRLVPSNMTFDQTVNTPWPDRDPYSSEYNKKRH